MKKFLGIALVVVVCFSGIFFNKVEAAEEPSAEEIKSIMEKHINNNLQPGSGLFLIEDPESKKLLQLTFEGLHEKVKYVKEENVYYACADFRSHDGSILYDIDFWVGTGPTGNLRVSDVIVHKENGVARFSYDGYTLSLLGEKVAPEAGTHHAPEASSY